MTFRDRLSTPRARFAIGALGLAAAVGSTFVVVNPASAEPSVDQVSKRVDTLYHQAEEAQERYHDATLELTDIQRDLKSLKADERRQAARLERARSAVEDAIVGQYEGQNLSAVGQVVVSDDPQAFLNQLSTMSAYSDFQDQLFSEYSV